MSNLTSEFSKNRAINPLVALLEQYPTLVVDGALSTELEYRGCDLRDPLWSAKALIETPDLIRQVHEDYLLLVPILSLPLVIRQPSMGLCSVACAGRRV